MTKEQNGGENAHTSMTTRYHVQKRLISEVNSWTTAFQIDYKLATIGNKMRAMEMTSIYFLIIRNIVYKTAATYALLEVVRNLLLQLRYFQKQSIWQLTFAGNCPAPTPAQNKTTNN
eukprot:3736122-Amphidinium_carterae.2